jgi:hypothetical protein
VSAEIQDADVVAEAGTDTAPVAGGALAVTTPVQASDLVDRLGTIKEAMQTAMQRDVDYGEIPGTNKPTLLKPGAEKLGVLFQLDMQITHEERWGPGDHLTVSAAAVVYHAPTGARLGRGEGMCSTRERKYAYRKAERVCPQCGKPAIIKGKEEYGGGWVCFKKKDGCGAKFPDGSQEIESQTVGDIENPDLPDLWNTVIKMARKRAQTDAVLLVTGASALFTQDIEDSAAGGTVDGGGPSKLDDKGTWPFGPPASLAVATSARNAIAWVLSESVNSEPVTRLVGEIERRAGGYFPEIVARAVGHVAAAAKAARELEEEDPETPADDNAAADQAARAAAEMRGQV